MSWDALREASNLIGIERARQEELKAAGKFEKTCADDMPETLKLAVLAEEFGEVAHAVLEGDTANLKEELAQVGAVAIAWLEALVEEKEVSA